MSALTRAWERMAWWISGVPPVAEVRRDPWRRLPLEPPLRAYGPGASTEFSTYLDGPSHVPIRSPWEAAEWLSQCQYASDRDLHGEEDAWLHPSTLELVRSGDCEDFALWGWRKLVDLGLDAHFVVGVRRGTTANSSAQRHAWVTFRSGDDEYLFDAVERTVERVVRPLVDVRCEYDPQVGVTPVAARYVFTGLYLTEWGRRLRLRRLPRVP